MSAFYISYLFSIIITQAFANSEAVHKVTTEINSWGLHQPAHLEFANECESLYLGGGQHGLFYDPKSHLINAVSLANYPVEFHEVLLAHEYAHSVFRANIKRVSQELDDSLDLSLNYRLGLQKELATSDSCDIDKISLSADFLNLEKSFLDLDYFTFASLRLGAYDELLADIFAVLYDGRGNAMYLALGGDTIDWGKKYFLPLPQDYRGRDFTYPLPIDVAFSENRKILFYDFLGAASDIYNVLDPVRYYLWENHMRQLPKNKYGLFIKAYLAAVSEEYKFYIDNAVWEQPVREMNERFILNLEKHMLSLNHDSSL